MTQPGLHNAHELDPETVRRIDKALMRIPRTDFILTARYQDKTQGIKVHWVQRMTSRPPLIVVVAIPKGSGIIPLLQDAHRFALCQVHPDDKLTLRRFAREPTDDPFNAIDIFFSPGGAPVIAKSLAYVECELLRHVDFEGDHDIYIGLVHHGDSLSPDAPIVHAD